MIYLIGGLPGMRKSSIISKKICDDYKGLFHISTDTIRSVTRNLLLQQTWIEGATEVEIKAKFRKRPGLDPEEIKFKIEDRDGDDEMVWRATVGLIKDYAGQVTG